MNGYVPDREAITQWRFSAIEFAAAWQRIGYDRLPFPFSYLAAATSQDHFRNLERKAAESVETVFDDDLEAALITLAKPAVQVQVCGFSDSRSVIRMIAGVDLGRGTAAIQLPSRDTAFGSDILVSTHAPRRIADTVIRRLPAAIPGTGTDINVMRRGAHSAESRVTYSITEERVHSSTAARLARPRSSFGDIIVGPRTVGGSRLMDPSNGFQWIDFADDGRYLVKASHTISVVPATGPALVAELQRRLDVCFPNPDAGSA